MADAVAIVGEKAAVVSAYITSLPFADDVVLAKLDCNEHSKYCTERHQIDHFPTVRAYANGGAEMVNCAWPRAKDGRMHTHRLHAPIQVRG